MLMKQKKTKKILNALLLLVGVIIFISMVAAGAETNAVMEFDEFVADYEPMPCSVNSFQEIAHFDPIILNPYELMAQIDECKSSDEIRTLSRVLELPLAANDCDYIYQCKNNRACTQYPLPKGQWKFSEAVTLTYTFADFEDSSDNLTFVFISDGENYSLIDVLPSFDNPQIVTDANHETLWLVGETRSGWNKSVRWYNLMCKKYSFSYLTNGVMADRIDYHVNVQSLADPIVNGTLPPNGMLAVRKQVSITDVTVTGSTEPSELLLYTQIDVYAYQRGADLTLIKSKKYEDAYLQTVSGITCEQIIDETFNVN